MTTGQGSLLIVDNDERIVELCAWFLEQRGYEVRSARSFVEAERVLRERAPDLLLSDVDLGEEEHAVGAGTEQVDVVVRVEVLRDAPRERAVGQRRLPGRLLLAAGLPELDVGLGVIERRVAQEHAFPGDQRALGPVPNRPRDGVPAAHGRQTTRNAR